MHSTGTNQDALERVEMPNSSSHLYLVRQPLASSFLHAAHDLAAHVFLDVHRDFAMLRLLHGAAVPVTGLS